MLDELQLLTQFTHAYYSRVVLVDIKTHAHITIHRIVKQKVKKSPVCLNVEFRIEMFLSETFDNNNPTT